MKVCLVGLLMCFSWLACGRGLAKGVPALLAGPSRRLTLIIRAKDNGALIPNAIAQATHEGHAHVHKANKAGVIVFDLDQDSVKVIVQAPSYGQQRLNLYLRNDTTISVGMTESIAEKDDIEIISQYQRSQSFATSILNKEELTKVKGQSLAEVLSQLSGVSLFKTGSSIVKPIIQGQSGQRIVIMNAGAKQEGQQWGDEHAPEIDPSIADSIVLIKGAAGVRYGPDAMGGVILIEPTIPQSTGGEVSLGAFSNNRMGFGNAMLQTNHYMTPIRSNVYARLQGSGKYAGDGQTPTYNLVNTGYREQNYSLLAGIKGAYGHLEGYYSLYQTQLGIFAGSHVGNLTDLNLALSRSEPAIRGPFSYDIGRPRQAITHELARLKYEYQWQHIKAGVVASRQYNTRQEFDILRTTADNASDRAQLNFRLTTYQAEAYIASADYKRLQSRVGLTALQQSNTWDGRFLIPSFINTGIGLYTTQSLKTAIGIWEAGLRVDHRQMSTYFNNGLVVNEVRRDWQGLAANLGHVSELGNHFKWLTNAGYAWRPPSVNELYSDGLHHGAAAIERGDPNLNAERSLKLTSSLEANWPTAQLTTTGYAQQFYNYVYMVPKLPAEQTIRGAFPVFEFVQVPALFYGFDVDASVKLTHQITLKGAVSIVVGQQQNTGQGLLFVPAPRLRANVNYLLLDEPNHQVYVGAGMQAVAKQTNAPADLDYAPAPNAYVLGMAEIGYRFKVQGQWATLHLHCDNALNTQYRDYLNRFRYYADEVGRNFSARLTVPFRLSRP